MRCTATAEAWAAQGHRQRRRHGPLLVRPHHPRIRRPGLGPGGQALTPAAGGHRLHPMLERRRHRAPVPGPARRPVRRAGPAPAGRRQRLGARLPARRHGRSRRSPAPAPAGQLRAAPCRRLVRGRRCRRRGRLPAARDLGRRRARRCSTTPTASAPCSANWTSGCWPKARTCGLYEMLGATPREMDGVAGTALRRLGAERVARQRGRRLQPLGRPPPPDAAAPRMRRVGALPARRARRRALQVRAARPRRPRCCRRRPTPSPARPNCARPPPASWRAMPPVAPPSPQRQARQRAGRADEHLRGAPRLAGGASPRTATAG